MTTTNLPPRRIDGRHDREAGHRRASFATAPESDPGLKAIARRVMALLLLGSVAAALLLAVPGLRGVAREARRMSPLWLVAAIALELASATSFVLVFRRFFDRLSPRDARELAWAEQATGALLPGGGAGGVAIGAWLVHQTGAAMEWVIRRSGGLFFFNSATNGLSIIAAGAALLAGSSGEHSFTLVTLPTIGAAAITLAVVLLAHVIGGSQAAPRWLRAGADGVRHAEEAAFGRPHWRLLGGFGYLGFDMAVLWVTLRALGAAPTVPDLVLAYNIGYLANVLPIPGGIGSARRWTHRGPRALRRQRKTGGRSRNYLSRDLLLDPRTRGLGRLSAATKAPAHRPRD